MPSKTKKTEFKTTEAVRRASREYRKRNVAKIKGKNEDYYRQHSEQLREKRRKRYAKKKKQEIMKILNEFLKIKLKRQKIIIANYDLNL